MCLDLKVSGMFKTKSWGGGTLPKKCAQSPGRELRITRRGSACGGEQCPPSCLALAGAGVRKTMGMACHHLKYLWNVQHQPGIMKHYVYTAPAHWQLTEEERHYLYKWYLPVSSCIEVGGVSDLGTPGKSLHQR